MLQETAVVNMDIMFTTEAGEILDPVYLEHTILARLGGVLDDDTGLGVICVAVKRRTGELELCGEEW